MSEASNERFDAIKENRETPPPVYFTILYFGLILWGLLFAAYYIFSGWTSHDEFQEKMDRHKTTHQETSSSAQSR